MSTRHTTFKDLTLAEFEAYAKTLLDHTVSGINRERQIAYLRRIVANDDGLIKSEQVLLSARRRLQRLQRAAIDTIESDHSLDFEAAPELFVDAPKTDAEIIALLTQDNATVYLRDRTLSGNIRITGNNVRLIGLGTTGTAVAGTLACTCTIATDTIQIGGDNVSSGPRVKKPLPLSLPRAPGSTWNSASSRARTVPTRMPNSTTAMALEEATK